MFPDVAAGVVASLEEEFAFLLYKKDAAGVTLEARVRVGADVQALTLVCVLTPLRVCTLPCHDFAMAPLLFFFGVDPLYLCQGSLKGCAMAPSLFECVVCI